MSGTQNVYSAQDATALDGMMGSLELSKDLDLDLFSDLDDLDIDFVTLTESDPRLLSNTKAKSLPKGGGKALEQKETNAEVSPSEKVVGLARNRLCFEFEGRCMPQEVFDVQVRFWF